MKVKLKTISVISLSVGANIAPRNEKVIKIKSSKTVLLINWKNKNKNEKTYTLSFEKKKIQLEQVFRGILPSFN